MTLAEYHQGYRERLGKWMLNPLDLEAFAEWMRWLSTTPLPAA